ncbi:adenosine deaminase 2-like [Colias croceus]|uniref:adenosine deaminase 2-like n=1 Tax=Colias crocea TaxID=72248 RepID=UPI001E281293|nr:adenosine deaminase 2-like [Colias croceus]
MFILIYFMLCSMFGKTLMARSLYEYNIERQNILDEEFEMQVGGRLRLTDEENIANDILMHWKHLEVQESFDNPQYFNFSKHYFKYRNQIEKSKVYQIIRKMPKGGALHVHSSLMLSADRVMELTYEDHLYACIAAGYLDLQFSVTTPQRPCPYKWHLLSELRNASDDVATFDAELRKHFTMYTDDESEMNRDINYTWKRFNKVCHSIKALMSYRPVREKYIYEGLQEFYNDNVRYMELRSGLSKLYELDGKVHDVMYLPRLIDRVAKKFKQTHPDFIGVKLIVTHRRYRNMTQMQSVINIARQIKKELPDIYAGLDLVGQEDLGKPLVNFLPLLVEAQDDVDFYFHAGESNWFGTSSDDNLVDAILLGSKRIGHGLALIKHPALMTAVKQRDIAIEINVISNIVLSLVSDVRNHPLATYLADGMPIVLSSDDPGAWDADPMSYDFYVAFVGVASKKADLRMLKQLVINSIRYSALDDRAKTSLFRLFHKNWQEFIENVITMAGLK